MRGYPLARIRGEVAFVAYYLHWSYDEVMSMDHNERGRWVEEASRINRRLNETNNEGAGR